jgi:DivIVA domain-containing protein
MKITALEIEQRQFEKSFRGYDPDEVNRYLANIAAEWDRMLSESKMLKMQLEIAEKEASKLREVETTLIKTLRTAEEAKTKITENAKFEADKKIEEANTNAQQIITDAQHTANQIIADAEQKSKNIHATAKSEYDEIEQKFSDLEHNKTRLLCDLKRIAEEAAKLAGTELHISNPVESLPKVALEIEKPVVEVAKVAEIEVQENTTETITEEAEEPVGISFESVANKISNEEPAPSPEQDLEIIEGIGPKIKEILYKARIRTFRDLATTPVYRLKDLLEEAGPHFSAHDPSTWTEQAILADGGNWQKLQELKDYLIAGRAPKVQEPAKAVDGTNTEEMLDKVNKVKAAIRKSMLDNKDTEPKSEPVKQGSFFDNLNI